MAKLLIMDDEFGIGELLRDLFTDEGHDVVLAVNGRQGLSLIKKERPDLVFLDLMMPVLDGFGVLQTMTVDPDLACIPVVVMSSLPESTIAQRIGRHVAYLRKPFQIDRALELAARILADKGRAAGDDGQR